IRCSSSSILISVPAYLPMRMRSPFFTSRGNCLPSSLTLPLPTATTSASIGFSLAVSGMMIPPFFISPISSRLTRIRSYSCRTFMNFLLEVVLPVLAPACRGQNRQDKFKEEVHESSATVRPDPGQATRDGRDEEGRDHHPGHRQGEADGGGSRRRR